jgi:hypothetical protein
MEGASPAITIYMINHLHVERTACKISFVDSANVSGGAWKRSCIRVMMEKPSPVRPGTSGRREVRGAKSLHQRLCFITVDARLR